MLLCATRLGGKGSRLPPPGDGGNYRFSVAAKVGFLWTPPFRQGKTLGSLLRVVGCCHLSGLRCGKNTAAGLYGSSRTGSRSPEACSKHSGKPWLSQPRLADCCAILSFRSPHALAIVVSLRRHGRSSVGATLDQQGPDDAGHLVSQSNGDQHLRLPSQHLRKPRALGCPAPAGLLNHGTRANDQQAADGPLTAFRNGPEFLLAADRFLQRRQP